MFVEIGQSRTGKTTRLINSVIEFLKNNLDMSALIVSPTISGYERKVLTKKIMEECPECESRIITSYKMLDGVKTIKQFVDDFSDMDEDNLVVDTNAYYNGIDYTDIFSPLMEPNKKREIYETFKLKSQIKPYQSIVRHNLCT